MSSNDRPGLNQSRSSAPRPPRWSSRTGPVARLAPALATAAAAFLLLYGLQMDPTAADPAPDFAAAPVVNEAPSPVMTDAADLGSPGMLAELAVPETPPKWQKTACETKRGEVAIRGGCYVELAEKPPCRDGHFRHEGRCWAAVAKSERPANAIGQ